MTDAEKIRVLSDALRRINEARIYRAEHGCDPDYVEDQEFDDWAGDLAAEALQKADCTGSPVASVPRVICITQGGLIQNARADVPVRFDVLDRDSQAAAEAERDRTSGAAEETQRCADLEAEYEKLPDSVY